MMDDNTKYQWAILACIVVMTIRLEILNSEVHKLKEKK